MENTNTKWVIGLIVAAFVFLFIGLPLIFGTWTIISPQEVGVVTRLGKINRTIQSGIHFKLPYVESVDKIDVSTQALPVDELSYSKDAQTVNAQVTINYAVSRTQVESLYREYRDAYEARLIIPAVKESIKVVFSNYSAQGLIEGRGKLPVQIKETLEQKLLNTGITVANINITNFDFDDAYENAIKAKQVQEQQALAQVNVTKQEEEKKKQEILKAEALSEKTRLEAQAMSNANSSKVIEKLYAEAALKAAEKWNGQLPQQMIPGSTLPFINLTK